MTSAMPAVSKLPSSLKTVGTGGMMPENFINLDINKPPFVKSDIGTCEMVGR
jgi:hypothetical protein